MSVMYEDLKTVAESIDEKNDCAVRAVSILSDMHYIPIHTMFTRLGRQHRRGARVFMALTVLQELQMEITDVTNNFKAKTVRTLTRELPEKGRFLILTRGHLLAYRNGKICDHAEGTTRRIIMIIKVSF